MRLPSMASSTTSPTSTIQAVNPCICSEAMMSPCSTRWCIRTTPPSIWRRCSAWASSSITRRNTSSTPNSSARSKEKSSKLCDAGRNSAPWDGSAAASSSLDCSPSCSISGSPRPPPTHLPSSTASARPSSVSTCSTMPITVPLPRSRGSTTSWDWVPTLSEAASGCGWSSIGRIIHSPTTTRRTQMPSVPNHSSSSMTMSQATASVPSCTASRHSTMSSPLAHTGSAPSSTQRSSISDSAERRTSVSRWSLTTSRRAASTPSSCDSSTSSPTASLRPSTRADTRGTFSDTSWSWAPPPPSPSPSSSPCPTTSRTPTATQPTRPARTASRSAGSRPRSRPPARTAVSSPAA
mmetsp:Transcript_19342/g.53806  ORF Transcript_19342/g.53806 Transcript_19342/m.53806 type:complete len:351 (-) Transcript_19342:948-2000(-)